MIKYGDCQGTYLMDEIVKGKRSWKNTSHAIWFSGYRWVIGDLKNVGTFGYVIFSTFESGSYNTPYDVPNDKWERIQSGDIIIYATGISSFIQYCIFPIFTHQRVEKKLFF